MSQMKNLLEKIWQGVRRVSGDDAYERYLQHWRTHHAHEDGQPLDCKAFHKAETDRRWNGIRRCC